MKLTPTQKNFRKQMKKIKFDDDDHYSYRNHSRTVKFVNDTEPSEKNFLALVALLI